MRSDRQQVHIPLLRTLDQHFLIEVKLLRAIILIQCPQVIDIVRVGIRIGKGKFDPLALIPKQKVKNTLQLPIFPQKKR
jgi:hypothetical protein